MAAGVALGAQQRDVLRSVLIEGLRPVVIGLVLGMAGGQIGAQWIRAALYGIGVFDPAALAGVSVVLLATAIVACYVPARRASAVDPMVALRAE